jgi:hypothetical protein
MASHAWTMVIRRAAAAVDRRSVLALGAGGVLPIGFGLFAATAETKKKRRKGCKKDRKECTALRNEYCSAQYDSPDTEACLADIGVCCQLLAKCKYKAANKCNRAIPW